MMIVNRLKYCQQMHLLNIKCHLMLNDNLYSISHISIMITLLLLLLSSIETILSIRENFEIIYVSKERIRIASTWKSVKYTLRYHR